MPAKFQSLRFITQTNTVDEHTEFLPVRGGL